MGKHLLSEKIKILADSLGIDAIGFTESSEFTGYVLSQHKRRDPKLSLENARSIIVAGIYIGGVTMPEWKTRGMVEQAGCIFRSSFLMS